MNIVQITPGAGGMYCGGCFHDNALVTALRKQGHDTLMVPLYLPLTLDEPDQSAETPVFFGGISVYLEQKLPLFRHMPRWMRHLLASRSILKWAAGKAAKTRAEEVGDLTLSMLEGEQGNQACEVRDLVVWLKSHFQPDIICLSNALLTGLVRRIKSELGVPVACLLQGEDSFLDGLPASHRDAAWDSLARRATEVDVFIAPSQYYGNRMAKRLKLSAEQMQVIPDGINLAGYESTRDSSPEANGGQPSPIVGYFSRMCPEKGLDTLVEAFLLLKQRQGMQSLRLHVGGGCGPNDEPFVAQQKERLGAAGWMQDVAFFPNVDREAKLKFLHGLTVFSAPALYGEAFGLYVIEAMAAGIPAVQPRHGGFPEIIAATEGGILYDPPSPAALADALESLLQDKHRARQLGRQGQKAVRESYTAEQMASNMVQTFHQAIQRKQIGS